MLADLPVRQIQEKHIAWLNRFGEERVTRFCRLFASDREAALCEALVADFLNQNIASIEPYEDLSSGGTDYVCANRGEKFYVEVACVKIAAIEKASRIPDDPKWDGGSCGSIARLVRTKVSNKVKQCTKCDAPVLIAVCHLHQWETMGVGKGLAEELLISDTGYTLEINPRRPFDRKPGLARAVGTFDKIDLPRG